MVRIKIDLKTLPPKLQYSVAVVIVVIVSIVAWISGRGKPIPDWIDNYLVPGLGWLGLLLIIVIVVSWIRKKRLSNKASKKPNGKVST